MKQMEMQNMITTIINNSYYYSLLIGQGYFIHVLFERLGITVKKEYSERIGYYINLAIIFVVTFFTLVISLVNEDIGKLVSPIILILGILYFVIVRFLYKPFLLKMPSIKRTTFVEKVIFAVIILTYLFINKNELNKVNHIIKVSQVQSIPMKDR